MNQMQDQIKGFTLVELVFAMTIIAIALAGVLMVVNTVTMRSADPMLLAQSAAIARTYLEEISSKAFPTSLPCVTPQPTGGRANYANVCDYKYIPAAGQVPTDQMGNPVAGLGRYNVRVNIDDTLAVLQGLTTGAGQVVRIDVTISNPNTLSTTYSVYRTND